MAMRTLTLAISPCPNDTAIFHALAHGLVRPRAGDEELSFAVTLADVEQLNALAARGGADVVKISVAAYPACAEEYVALRCGGALGRGVGPLLVAGQDVGPEALAHAPIAIPGRMTTANLLLGLSGLFRGERRVMRYDEVMDAVASGAVPAGVLIHEGRFTFAAHGLSRVMDLGAWWEEAYGAPLPLGLIAARRSLGGETIRAVAQGIRASLARYRAQPGEAAAWIAANAQELAPDVVAQHIATFVTEFSMDLGQEGERALLALLAEAFRAAGRAMPDGVLAAEKE